MKITGINPYLKFLIGAIIGFALAAFIRSCNSDITTEPTTQQQALTGKLDTHAIQAAIERQYQQRETKLITAYSDSLAKSKVIARKKGDKAVVSVKAYQNAPSIAKCDTAIADLQSQVSELETTVAITDTIIASQNRLNASLNGTILRQESVISEVGKIGQDALTENAVLQKKLKRRNRLIAIGAGAIALFVGGVVANR